MKKALKKELESSHYFALMIVASLAPFIIRSMEKELDLRSWGHVPGGNLIAQASDSLSARAGRFIGNHRQGMQTAIKITLFQDSNFPLTFPCIRALSAAYFMHSMREETHPMLMWLALGAHFNANIWALQCLLMRRWFSPKRRVTQDSKDLFGQLAPLNTFLCPLHFMAGSAMMYDAPDDETWIDTTQIFIGLASIYFILNLTENYIKNRCKKNNLL